MVTFNLPEMSDQDIIRIVEALSKYQAARAHHRAISAERLGVERQLHAAQAARQAYATTLEGSNP
jgi:hypothetical protein